MIRASVDYAAHLLGSLGCPETPPATFDRRHPALAWAASGAMALTGPADGAPVVAPGDLAGCARGAIAALQALAGERWRASVDGAALLGERAAILGLDRHGVISPGGACRLLETRTGWMAITLARPDDLALVPAWLGEPLDGDPWEFVARRVARRAARRLVARARLLGLAAAEAVLPPCHVPRWCRIARLGAPLRRRLRLAPLVVDLSALWAGPLATHLLELAGAYVIKVESVQRPDGARRGAAEFYDLLNADKLSVALDVGSAADVARLRALIASSDIVVESARPRALTQLGIDARALVADVPGLTWISITGYGRVGRGANWAAYGDDAGVAAGLATATGIAGSPIFCADAIADPLAGMHAAVAALASWQRGGGQLVDIALRDVVAHAAAFGAGGPHSRPKLRRRSSGDWEVVADDERRLVAPPRARPVAGIARPLGADTDMVLRSLAA